MLLEPLLFWFFSVLRLGFCSTGCLELVLQSRQPCIQIRLLGAQPLALLWILFRVSVTALLVVSGHGVYLLCFASWSNLSFIALAFFFLKIYIFICVHMWLPREGRKGQ